MCLPFAYVGSRLVTVFHIPYAWNYHSSHRPSSGDALRLSCLRVQTLTPAESATDTERRCTHIFDYITLQACPRGPSLLFKLGTVTTMKRAETDWRQTCRNPPEI